MSSSGAAIFCKGEQVLNAYGDGYYQKYTCSVCGGTWTNDNRNDQQYQSHHCEHMYYINEWDGTREEVHATIVGDTVQMVYSDGTRHDVAKDYFFGELHGRYVSQW
jgi:hypothetical protein